MLFICLGDFFINFGHSWGSISSRQTTARSRPALGVAFGCGLFAFAFVFVLPQGSLTLESLRNLKELVEGVVRA